MPSDPDRRYILALGRVVDKKGFDLLLSAFAAMEGDRRTADLVIAGAGPALEGLQRMAGELGVGDQVHFVGRLSRQDVASAMAGATAFVMPSRLEPFGIVVLEAWRAGVAVVATNRGGAPEFVDDGETGVLVDPFDTRGFAAALTGLLSDDVRRLAIGRAGHDRVRAFDWTLITEQYRRLYASIVDGTAADRGPDPRRGTALIWGRRWHDGGTPTRPGPAGAPTEAARPTAGGGLPAGRRRPGTAADLLWVIPPPSRCVWAWTWWRWPISPTR